jgi:hypothetical protein
LNHGGIGRGLASGGLPLFLFLGGVDNGLGEVGRHLLVM